MEPNTLMGKNAMRRWAGRGGGHAASNTIKAVLTSRWDARAQQQCGHQARWWDVGVVSGHMGGRPVGSNVFTSQCRCRRWGPPLKPQAGRTTGRTTR